MQIETKTEFREFDHALELGYQKVTEIVKNSGLQGRGGANFSTGMKWELTRVNEGLKVLICNADEGEPGTFKDRHIIMHNPDLLIEGIAIAAYAIDANRAYIYLRGEYETLKKRFELSIKKHSIKLNKIHLQLDIFLGAGAYVCGDETAIMNSIEGKRGEPRTKPPYPAKSGLFAQPTCINNVETLSNVPLILKGGWKQLRLFSLSGNVTKPGIYEFPLGIKARQLIELGMPKKKIKALYFGCAGGCVPYDPEMTLDIDTVRKAGAMLGSCTVVAVDENQSIPEMSKCISEFFVHESCGDCNPCREGNFRIWQSLAKLNSGEGSRKDITILEDISGMMGKVAFCGLGQSSGNHVSTGLRYFRKEFEDLCK